MRVGLRSLAGVTVVILVAGAVSVASVGAASSFALAVSPSVDTPSRDVTFQGQTFTIAGIGRVQPGEAATATVELPPDTSIELLLYNGDGEILDQWQLTEDGSQTIPTEYPGGDLYATGTYTVAVQHDGAFELVHPLVVEGYGVSVNAPTSAVQDSSMTVEASVTEIDPVKPIDRLQVVIADDNNQRRVTLTDQGNDQYAATFTTDTLPAGDYSLYVVVQGSKEVLGRQELLGLSDAQSFTLTEPTPTATATESDGSTGGTGGGGGGGGGGGQATATPTDTQTPPPTTSTPATVTRTASPTTASPPSTQTTITTTVVTRSHSPPATIATSQTPDSSGTTALPATSDTSVITPRPSTSRPSSSDTTNTPGQSLGFLPPLLALLSTVLVWRRRG